MPDIDRGQIHLWFVFLDEIRDARLLDQYRRLLTEEERHQERRFFFAKDQHRYLVTRALLRTTLSRYAPIAPEQWSFYRNAYGRPEIANDDCRANEISFNVSHTLGLIMLAVTGKCLLGVDTENVRTRQVSPDLATHFFSRAEATALQRLPVELQHERFFQYWTLKESYIKARGMGLSIPLDQFSFHFSADGPRPSEVLIIPLTLLRRLGVAKKVRAGPAPVGPPND